jgi:hypothetical protein
MDILSECFREKSILWTLYVIYQRYIWLRSSVIEQIAKCERFTNPILFNHRRLIPIFKYCRWFIATDEAALTDLGIESMEYSKK